MPSITYTYQDGDNDRTQETARWRNWEVIEDSQSATEQWKGLTRINYASWFIRERGGMGQGSVSEKSVVENRKMTITRTYNWEE